MKTYGYFTGGLHLILSLCKVEMRSTVYNMLIIRRSLASTLHNDMLVIKEIM
jgi:hypothetical protein